MPPKSRNYRNLGWGNPRGGRVESLLFDPSELPKMMPVGITIAATPNSTHELPHHGLLGRDFLSHFTMVYAGSSGRFDLHVSGALPRDR